MYTYYFYETSSCDEAQKSLYENITKKRKEQKGEKMKVSFRETWQNKCDCDFYWKIASEVLIVK